MFCNRCGANLPDGTQFCTNCGAPQTAPQQPAPQATPFQFAPQAAPAAPVKKSGKGKKLGITAAIIAAVLVVSLLTTALCRDFYRDTAFAGMANFYDKMLLSDADYLKEVTSNTVNDLSDDVKKAQEQEKINPENMGLDASIKVDVGDELIDLADEYAGFDLSFLESIEGTFELDAAENGVKFGGEVSLNEVALISALAIVDYDEELAYITLPELTDAAGYTSIPMDDIETALAEYADMKKKVDVECYTKLIDDILAGAVEEIEDDVKMSSEKVKAGGVEQKLTQLTVELDTKKLINVGIAALKAAKSSDHLEDVVESVADMSNYDDAEDLYEDFKDSLDELIDNLKDAKEYANVDVEIELNFYVDNKGELVGLTANASADEFDEEYDLKLLKTVKGKNEGFELSVSEKSTDEGLSISGKGTRKNDKLTGEYTVEVNGEEYVEISLKDWSAKDNLLNGTITIAPTDELLEILEYQLPAEIAPFVSKAAIEVTFETTEKKVSVATSILYSKAELITLTLAGELRELDDDFSIDADQSYDLDDYQQSNQFAATFDTAALLENLKEAGIDEEVIQSIVSLLMNLGNSTQVEQMPSYDDYYGDYYDGYYDDDYYYGDEEDYYDDWY